MPNNYTKPKNTSTGQHIASNQGNDKAILAPRRPAMLLLAMYLLLEIIIQIEM
jgi:hypothetical protein